MIPLFERFPGLSQTLPYRAFADLPTPLSKMQRLGEYLGLDSLWLKHDDVTGKEYGGNKVRKLEFLLADALEQGVVEVMTFGYAGSNHALATAISARKLGLGSISMLLKQVKAPYIKDNLLFSYMNSAELHHYSSIFSRRRGTIRQRESHKARTGKYPYLIPGGGSTPVGIAGFVNAGLELAMQVEQGLMPRPDFIYAGMGTMGTAAGLALGSKAAGLDCTVIAACATSTAEANSHLCADLYDQTNLFLHRLDPAFPLLPPAPDDIVIRSELYVQSYGVKAPAVDEALALAWDLEGLALDQTYTAKALATIIADARAGLLAGKTIVFWNTYNSRDLSNRVKGMDWHELPPAFHHYFT
jgi:D-cysteine desulfhydrase